MALEVIKDIAAIVGCITAIFSLLTICSKTVRNWISSLFKKKTQDLVDANEEQDTKIDELNSKLDEFILESREARQELK